MSNNAEALTPRQPSRTLLWPDSVQYLRDKLAEHEQPVYIVGGAVRDAWRHHPVHDLDLAVPKKAISLARRIADLTGGAIFILDQERDVARVLLDAPGHNHDPSRLVIDVAGFRAADLLGDLLDRDFTINAMVVDLRGDLGQLIDPLNGEQDLKNRVIRRCSANAIHNDPLRALRAIRQGVQFSARIEAQTLADLRQADLSSISAERLRDELARIFMLERPWTAMRLLGVLGLLDNIVPEIAALKSRSAAAHGLNTAWDQALLTIEKLSGILNTISAERSDAIVGRFEMGMVVMALDRYRHELQSHLVAEWPEERSHVALLRMGAALLQAGAEQAGARARDLRLSNDEKKRLAAMIEGAAAVLRLPHQPDDLTLHRFWYRRRESGVDACLLAMAHYLALHANSFDQDDWIRQLEKIRVMLEGYFQRHDAVIAPPPLVNGQLLMDELGMKPGSKIGTLLNLIREGQVTGEIQSLEDALDAARLYISSNGRSNER